MIARSPDPNDVDSPPAADTLVTVMTVNGARTLTWAQYLAERAARRPPVAAPTPPPREPTIRARTHTADSRTVKRRVEELVRAELADAPPNDEASVQVELQRRTALMGRIMDESAKRSSTTTTSRRRVVVPAGNDRRKNRR